MMSSNGSKSLFLSCIAVFLFIMAQGLYAVGLERAVLYTLETNPDINEKKENLKSVKKDIDIVRSAYYPKLYFSLGGGLAKEKITPSFRPTGEQVWRNDTSLTASINLFDGFYTTNDEKSQKSREESASYYLQEYENSVAMTTIETYITMMKQKAILGISEENVFSHKQIYDKLFEKVKSGFGNASDLEFGSGRLTLAEVNKIVIENNFIQSKVIFETIYGKTVMVDELEEPIFEYTLPKTLEDAALIALDYNPSISVSQKNIESSKSNYQKSKSLHYPKVDFEIRQAWFDENHKNSIYDYKSDSSQAMLYLTYNIFNGMADKATIEKEFYAFKQNSEYLEYAKRNVAKKIGTSWISAIKIKEQLDLLEEMKFFSKKTMEAYYAEFGIGKRSLLDLINVKNDYNNARQSYETAKYDLLIAKFRILEAMGGLVDYFKAKSDSMNLNIDEKPQEYQSVMDIIKDMDKKLQSGKPYVEFDEDNATNLDEYIQDSEDGELMDELDFLQDAIDN